MLNPNYIVGLVDGEGSFTIYVRNPRFLIKTKRRVTVEPKFYLKLIEKDKQILYQLQEFFGCGSVYFQKDIRKNHQNCYRYEVFRRDDLEKVIIPFFKKYPLKLASKQKDFKIFCNLLLRIINNEHLHDKGLRKIYDIKLHMH